ncbi:hypothetical protein CR513_43213, partial [Mucuna pruriens]
MKVNANAAKEDWKQAGIKAETDQTVPRPIGDVSPPKPPIELKPLPDHLKYAYLGDEQQFSVIIANNLHQE